MNIVACHTAKHVIERKSSIPRMFYEGGNAGSSVSAAEKRFIYTFLEDIYSRSRLSKSDITPPLY